MKNLKKLNQAIFKFLIIIQIIHSNCDKMQTKQRCFYISTSGRQGYSDIFLAFSIRNYINFEQ